jgi:transglutaminase-like putative cysteine protease
MHETTCSAGVEMPILTVRHVTAYYYKTPVAFGEHRMMLRPRDDDDQQVLETKLEITPEPSQLTWTRDVFGNHVAMAGFADRAAELRFESVIRLDHAPSGLGDIEDFAATYPFAYAPEDRSGLARFVAPRSQQPELKRWAAGFLRKDGSADTRELLVNMTQTINRNFRHLARHEEGVQGPALTLKLASGSCRDLAVFMIAALRSLGFAARFVSGYLHLADDDPDRDSGGNTHAWVQVCLPGPGWVDCDPSSGMVGNQNLVRVAVVREPSGAIPLQGTWIGTPSDYLAMKVTVRVAALAADSARLPTMLCNECSGSRAAVGDDRTEH